MAGGDDEMFMTGSLNVTPKTTEQHLIINQSINRILFQTANVHRNIIMIMIIIIIVIMVKLDIREEKKKEKL